MSTIIDRRFNSKNKSAVNRQRFMDRYRRFIKKAVSDSLSKRSITDVTSGSEVVISRKSLSEPVFQHGKGGFYQQVMPGNKHYVQGDKIKRSLGQGGKNSGGGNASNTGEGEDDFSFQIDHEEFLSFMFDDLALPNMEKKGPGDYLEAQWRQAGINSSGSPERLNIIRSLRSAHARRIALTGKDRSEIRALKRQLRELEVGQEQADQDTLDQLRQRIAQLNQSVKRLPFIDEFDLKYNNFVRDWVPTHKAVMFCVMDVSGSMTRDIKELAKRFFILLYLFLKRNYQQIDVVFIRHHTAAKEVNEDDFFYSRETGGTIVSSALKKTLDVIEERFPKQEWNVYVAQASDGDNWEGDSSICSKLLQEHIIPKVQYFSYIEITDRDHQNLWREYEQVVASCPDTFAMEQVKTIDDIYPVFRRLFEKNRE